MKKSIRMQPFYLVLLTLVSTSMINGEETTYDFIIVGGGTAGCVVARRLSDANFNVLLLETGQVPTEEMSIPVNTVKYIYMSGTSYTYQYAAVPSKNSALASGGIAHLVTAKLLGGGSSLTSMRYMRGSPEAYDEWAKVSEDDSWKYANFLKFIKRSENYHGEYPSDQHGTEGPIPVSRDLFANRIGKDVWLSAGEELGYKIKDPNGPQGISFTGIEVTTLNGRRVSSYTGYLKPIKDMHKNLKILTGVMATEIIFEGNKATGVKYKMAEGDESIKEATARFEIVLSAGVIGSPKLLMLSGVGPKEHLNAAKINLVKDLPVGQNLVDYPLLMLQFVVNNKSLVYDPAVDLNAESLRIFNEKGEGPFTTVIGYAGQAFLASSITKEDGFPEWSDIEIVYQPRNAALDPWKDVKLKEEERFVQVWIFQIRGKSPKGTVSLNLEDSKGPPVIDFKYLEDKRDEDAFLYAINVTMEVMTKTKAFQGIGARYLEEPLKPCEDKAFLSEDYWRCYVKQMSLASYHPSGTNSLGAVVSNDLAVKGVDKLRVVDASVIPVQANVNLQTQVYAIAEKASEIMINKYK